MTLVTFTGTIKNQSWSEKNIVSHKKGNCFEEEKGGRDLFLHCRWEENYKFFQLKTATVSGFASCPHFPFEPVDETLGAVCSIFQELSSIITIVFNINKGKSLHLLFYPCIMLFLIWYTREILTWWEIRGYCSFICALFTLFQSILQRHNLSTNCKDIVFVQWF